MLARLATGCGVAALLLVACDAPAGNAQGMPEREDIGALAMPPADLDRDEAPSRSAPALAAATIPGEFHGRWAATRARCGQADETALVIAAGSLRFYESEGRPERVTPAGARTIEVLGRFAGEGESWSESYRLGLSADGRMLTVATRGASMQRYRC